MRVVLATANPGKQREFATLLAPRGFELVLQSALGIDSVAETGNTFEDNALLKANHSSRQSSTVRIASAVTAAKRKRTSIPIFLKAKWLMRLSMASRCPNLLICPLSPKKALTKNAQKH